MLTVDEEIYRLAPRSSSRPSTSSPGSPARARRRPSSGTCRAAVRAARLRPPRLPALRHQGRQQAPGQGRLRAAAVRPVTRLRPPDLIIQDELHLITGALGTTVGLFEVAIDALTSWRTAAGPPARPLLVASTATARNAPEQVRALYGRSVTIFPPLVLDAGRTFFSREEAGQREAPGGGTSASPPAASASPRRRSG